MIKKVTQVQICRHLFLHVINSTFAPIKQYDTMDVNCDILLCLVNIGMLVPPSGIATDGCFPRARPQPPWENHSAGSSDTCFSQARRNNHCCSRRSHRPSLTRTRIDSCLKKLTAPSDILVFLTAAGICETPAGGQA